MTGSAAPSRALAALAVLAATVAAPGAVAQEGPFPTDLAMTEGDTAPAGTCNAFTVRLTGPDQAPVEGATVDVLQTLRNQGVEPDEDRELSFCDPSSSAGPNPTGQGGTQFADVQGNNPAATAGQAGRNTTVRAEVGPTDANGDVTFGISLQPETASATVDVLAWSDGGIAEGDDVFDEGEPSDSATKTWVPGEDRPVVSLDAVPESASRTNGGAHQVTVTVLTALGPAVGVVPSSIVLADATGRPAGDVVDPGAGPSPNSVPGDAKPAVYRCTPSNPQGVSTCTYQDAAGTPAGTDTVLFFVNEDGTAGPGAGDPQDAVQVTWAQPPPPTATPTPTPGPGTPEARNVRLCHGDSATPVCDTAVAERHLGDEHALAALVTDRDGSPLAGVPVELRETGPAGFTPGGTSAIVVTTGADGTARGTLTPDVLGTSTVVAEISPAGATGGFRGPAPADDECEQPAGPGGVPPAGNCVSQPLTVTWSTTPHATICTDGLDNDNDGFVDMDDPGCEDEADDSETPGPAIETVRHERTINMRFRDWAGPGDEGLVIFGRVRLAAGADDFRSCTQGQEVRIQRFVDGDWKTRKTATTNARGRYTGVLFDKPGPYRAVAPRTELFDAERTLHYCRRAEKEKTHHHRR